MCQPLGKQEQRNRSHTTEWKCQIKNYKFGGYYYKTMYLFTFCLSSVNISTNNSLKPHNTASLWADSYTNHVERKVQDLLLYKVSLLTQNLQAFRLKVTKEFSKGHRCKQEFWVSISNLLKTTC